MNLSTKTIILDSILSIILTVIGGGNFNSFMFFFVLLLLPVILILVSFDTMFMAKKDDSADRSPDNK